VDDIIPVIPLYLKGNFEIVVEAWFKPSVDIGVDGFEFFKESNKVLPIRDNILVESDVEWNQDCLNNDYDNDSIDAYNTDDEHQGFAIEFGELNLLQEGRTTNLQDDSFRLTY